MAGKDMSFPRYLCADLVELRSSSGDSVVNLEEIWINGAVLDAEEPLEEGANVEIRCRTAFFEARIVQVEQHEFGWRCEVEFSPDTPWNPERFQPQHLLDVSELKRREETGES